MKTIKILFLLAVVAATFVACSKEETQSSQDELLSVYQISDGETESPDAGKD